jgi:hypothetical protein
MKFSALKKMGQPQPAPVAPPAAAKKSSFGASLAASRARRAAAPAPTPTPAPAPVRQLPIGASGMSSSDSKPILRDISKVKVASGPIAGRSIGSPPPEMLKKHLGNFKKGGKVKSASVRADGIAVRGKTRA